MTNQLRLAVRGYPRARHLRLKCPLVSDPAHGETSIGRTLKGAFIMNKLTSIRFGGVETKHG